MIIVGYPGTGKSTMAKKCVEVVDLESSVFRDRGSKDGWIGGDKGLNSYIWLATNLNDDGKVVCISSHKEVREKLLSDARVDVKDVCYICPKPSEKAKWISHLYDRWIKTTDMKDWYAYTRAQKSFDKDVESMLKDKEKGVKVVEIGVEDLKDGLMLYLIHKGIVKPGGDGLGS